MKRNLFFILLLLLSVVCFSDEYVFNAKGERVLLKNDFTWEKVNTPNGSEFTFRNTSWGMNKEFVKASEKIELQYEEENVLVYKDELGSFDVNVVYIFSKDKLVRTKYMVLSKHTNETDYISDYNTLKEILIKKYGDPKEDEQIWKNDLYKSNSSEWGMAIAVGQLFYYCQWSNKDTSLILYLSGENYEIEFGIEYISVELGELENQERTEDMTNKL